MNRDRRCFGSTRLEIIPAKGNWRQTVHDLEFEVNSRRHRRYIRLPLCHSVQLIVGGLDSRV